MTAVLSLTSCSKSHSLGRWFLPWFCKRPILRRRKKLILLLKDRTGLLLKMCVRLLDNIWKQIQAPLWLWNPSHCDHRNWLCQVVCSILQDHNQSKNYHRQNKTICIIFIRNYHHQNSHFYQTVKAVDPFPSFGGARSCNCPDACGPQVLRWLHKIQIKHTNTSTKTYKYKCKFKYKIN